MTATSPLSEIIDRLKKADESYFDRVQRQHFFSEHDVKAEIGASIDDEVRGLREALKPFAAMKLSTEPEISDCMWRSHSAQLREQANAIELRDAQISQARAALKQGETHGAE